MFPFDSQVKKGKRSRRPGLKWILITMLFVYVGILRLSVMVARCLYWFHRVSTGGCLSRQLSYVSELD